MIMIRRFLKDQLLDILGYAIISGVLLLFFYLKFGNRIELIYPLVMVGFVLFIIMCIKFLHYYSFQKALEKDDFTELLLHGATNQEKAILKVVEEQKSYYQNEMSHYRAESDESKAFLTHMIHDMKIPIALIKLLIDDMEPIDEKQSFNEDYTTKINTANNQVLDKLNQLLSYLRLGQFEKDYYIEEVNLIDEIRIAINEKKDYFILNNIYPKFDSRQEAVYVLTDRKWQRMLLDQLISNAIKYSAAKKADGYVEFEVKYIDNFVELSIIDQGIGIAEHDMKRIFEPFFTGENGRLLGNSSGIGLYLCRYICDKLHHQISITSVRGKKTEATIRYLSKM